MTTDPRIPREIARRRTFAIISHPDAGKTTLTEKLLLYSGVVQTAGLVKNRKGKLATSDWMGMEQARGISITSSAMQFQYRGHVINVLDTPGHEDFSEDTFRTLTAADSAIMVLDASKGVEAQTRKLFEVCRLRGIPILTFVNKLDLPGRDPLDLMAEVEEALGIESSAMNWPVGSGRDFRGVVDRRTKELMLFEKTAAGGSQKSDVERVPLDSPIAEERLGSEEVARVREELELLQVAGNEMEVDRFLRGEVTPTFFGSALTNFGLEPFFDAFVELAPAPSGRMVDEDSGDEVLREATEPFSAFIFKIQANMDPRHRDCVSFMRICSGSYTPDLQVNHRRLGKKVRLARPQSIVAKERHSIEEAFAGDVVGLVGKGLYQIGDTLSNEVGFAHKPLPQFQPELFARIAPYTTSDRKKFDKGMKNLITEGAVQQMWPDVGPREPLIGAVGALQFESLQYRLKDEYAVDTRLTSLPYASSAWLAGDEDSFKAPTNSLLARDDRGRRVILFVSDLDKRIAMQQNPDHELLNFA
ncbi:MAG: peptide chain release factor 3 [Planctomycetota bacterium]|nr:peptide chain release factor 3 [Planctomycetota bacterium]MDG1983763.1 peptide chain release factor 3 [Planctomycetota bacterium]